MTDQERREAVAAVDVHDRQVQAAQQRVDGATEKLRKYREHVKAIEAELSAAKKDLAAERHEADKVRQTAERVLADGPVSLSGVEVKALAQTAGAVVEGKGADS